MTGTDASWIKALLATLCMLNSDAAVFKFCYAFLVFAFIAEAVARRYSEKDSQ